MVDTLTKLQLSNAQVAANCAAQILSGAAYPLSNVSTFEALASQILEWLEKTSYSPPVNLGVS